MLNIHAKPNLLLFSLSHSGHVCSLPISFRYIAIVYFIKPVLFLVVLAARPAIWVCIRLWFHWLTSIGHGVYMPNWSSVPVTRPQRLNCFTLVLPSSSSPFILYSLRARAAQSRLKVRVEGLLDEWYIKGFPFLVLRTLQHKIDTTSPDSESFNYWKNLAGGELVLSGRCRLWHSAKMLLHLMLLA